MTKCIPLSASLNLSESIGGKGRGIVRLLKAGANVPETVCIPPGVDARDAVAESLEHFRDLEGKGSFAVRSSAPVEDGSEKSWAGQFESLLRICGPESLIEAVKRCRSSGSAVGTFGEDIPVLIQKMIDAEFAGVLFTCDPVTGSRNHVIIELVKGTAEHLLQGRQIGHRYICAGEAELIEQPCQSSPPAGSPAYKSSDPLNFDMNLLRELIKGARSLEERLCGMLKGPLDFEWALRSGEIFWLQVRPVTATGGRPGERILFIGPGEKPEVREGETFWTTMNAREALPEVMPPLMSDYLIQFVMQGFTASVRLIGGSMKDLERYRTAGVFEGRVFLNISDLQKLTSRLPFRNPEVLVEQIITGGAAEEPKLKLTPRLIGALPRMILRDLMLPLDFKRYEKSERSTWAWPDEDSLRALDVRELADCIDELMDFVKTFALHVTGSMKYMQHYAFIQKLSLRHHADPSPFLQGLGTLLFASAAHSLRDVAWALGENRSLLFDEHLSVRSDWKQRLSSEPGLVSFRQCFDDYLEKYGHLGEGSLNFHKKNWREEPEMVLGLIGELLKEEPVKSRTQHLAELREKRRRCINELSTRLTLWEKLLFSIGLFSMHQSAPFRENIKFYAHRRMALAKIYLMEVAKRLQENGLIKEADDIFFLTRQEFQKLTEAQPSPVSGEVIEMRRSEYNRQLLRPWPLHRVEGTDGIRLYYAAPPGERREFKGIGASAGTVIGSARVIRNLGDAHRLRKGEILVTITTDPSWTSYFSIAAAIVVEVGSLLSHGAVVAREVGIPAVLGIPGIMGAIRDGDTLIVNGTDGTVEIRKK